MFFKGSIYITDPCYITRDEDWMEEKGFDIDNYTINAPEFTDYLLEDTGVGDGSWKVYQVKEEDFTTIDDLFDIIEDTDNDLSSYSVIGRFAADAGMSCVVYKKEADAYNPDFKKELGGTDNNGCLATIKDFEGEIITYFDDDGELHFIGKGNKIFFTA